VITVVHGVDDLKRDTPTRIHLGEHIPSARPAVYVSQRWFGNMETILWCFFHRKDWTKTGGFIGRRDSHEFDFEGALQYCLHDQPNRPYGWVTVFHHDLRFYRSFSKTINIESQGHGIYLNTRPPKADAYQKLVFDQYDANAFDIDEPRRLAWLEKQVQPIFNPRVHMPWQWNDWIIRRRFGEKTNGLIYKDPIKLLEYAIRVNKIRRNQWQDIQAYAEAA